MISGESTRGEIIIRYHPRLLMVEVTYGITFGLFKSDGMISGIKGMIT